MSGVLIILEKRKKNATKTVKEETPPQGRGGVLSGCLGTGELNKDCSKNRHLLSDAEQERPRSNER